MLKKVCLLLCLITVFSAFRSQPDFKQNAEAPIGDIRALYIEIGHNMWCDWPTAQMGDNLAEAVKLLPASRRPDLKLRCQDAIWKEVTDYAASKGVNMLVVDLGEGLRYPSHPELAIEGSWSVEKLRKEITRFNALGIEVVPKLNFSCTHNGWLKDYRHMVSTPEYYKVCEELIADVVKVFGGPRFFHIGFDEEDYGHQRRFSYQCSRTGEVWWADFLFFVRTVEKYGARPWVWSDYGWAHPEYYERCPKSVIQQNWYYDEEYAGFDPATNKTSDLPRLLGFWNLEKNGYDQVPCGTNWVSRRRREAGMDADEVMGNLVRTCRKVISKEHLYGFMMAPWYVCDSAGKAMQIRGIDLFEEALRSSAEPRNTHPYADVDFSTCHYINGATHMHAPMQSYIDQAREHNIEFFTISNYYPSAPTYPAAEMKVPRGYPYADQGLTRDGAYVKGHYDWNKIVGQWADSLPERTARAFDINRTATYPFKDNRKRMYTNWDPSWLEAPNAEHHNFRSADGSLDHIHVCAPGSMFTSGNFDSKNKFLLEDHGFARGCGLTWQESFNRMIAAMLYPDGGGITINHPVWSNLDRSLLLEMLDFDPRVLGIEVITEGYNNEHYWDWVLSTGRQCFGFFTPDWMVKCPEDFGVCVLLVPERTQHACLKAYRDGNFYGALKGKGALKFTSISFGEEGVKVATDKPARFEVKTALGVVASGEGAEFEWKLPHKAGNYRGSAQSHVFVRVKAYALDGSGEVLFTQPYIVGK